MPDLADAAQQLAGPSPGQTADDGASPAAVAAQLAQEEPKPKKYDPVYHVFELSAVDLENGRIIGACLTADKPIHAPNRQAATDVAKERPDLAEGEDDVVEPFLVIKEEELQIIRRRTKSQRVTDTSFE